MRNCISIFLIVGVLISSNQKLCAQKESQDTNTNFIQEIYQYPGGETARINFLKENIVYPDSAKVNGIAGTVYVSFIIETDGSVSDIRIIRGIGYGCDEEVIRVFKLMPNWIPAKQRGIAVRTRVNYPVKFKLF
ncbi:MAG: energy transducer TonB [Saprospiraceae bacterium]|nr:energy transducer TonB [Saprospiraceae bacterium]